MYCHTIVLGHLVKFIYTNYTPIGQDHSTCLQSPFTGIFLRGLICKKSEEQQDDGKKKKERWYVPQQRLNLRLMSHGLT